MLDTPSQRNMQLQLHTALQNDPLGNLTSVNTLCQELRTAYDKKTTSFIFNSSQ